MFMKLLSKISILLIAVLLGFTSCGDDEPFDSSKLEGVWKKVIDDRIMDGGMELYQFFPEASYSGRIEKSVSNWPDEGWTVTDLNYRVGETGHMNIFTGKTHDGKSQIYLEVDIKINKSEMIWYKTDSDEEIARFKKENVYVS